MFNNVSLMNEYIAVAELILVRVQSLLTIWIISNSEFNPFKFVDSKFKDEILSFSTSCWEKICN